MVRHVGGGDTERVNVLLVDDEADIAEVTALHLERRREEFDVTFVTGGPAALEIVDSSRVDCVVSDYEMPEMDGLALMRADASGPGRPG